MSILTNPYRKGLVPARHQSRNAKIRLYPVIFLTVRVEQSKAHKIKSCSDRSLNFSIWQNLPLPRGIGRLGCYRLVCHRGQLHARKTHVIRPFCVSGHYFSRHAMFRSDQELGARGSRTLHKISKFSYVFLI